ncbi:MAG: YjjG family noncanonical pyrimidine nucleotidase [Clostridia bacterium]|nr:YjjG family noncanonical pyrimidine nucleotidase [Clostridia bacterium]
MIKTVFIDIDNTLLDFNESSKECIRQAFGEQGLPFIETTFPTFKTINDGLWLKIEKGELDRPGLHKIRFNLVLEALGLKGDGPLIEKRFREILFDTAIAVDGARDTLKYLASKYKVYAASNAIYLQQINRLTKTNMIEFFSGLFISEKLGVTKPTKEFFDACMLGANAKKEETVMIGDSISADIIGAKEYGLKTVWYNHNKESKNVGEIADYIVNNLVEIKNIL